MGNFRFREMYRLPRFVALDFLEQLEYCMDMKTENLCPDIPLNLQFCATLNFLASGSYQRRVGSDAFASISQSCVSRSIKSITRVIATKMMDDYIRFPQSLHEIQELELQFQTLGHFRGLFAIIDDTHIALTAMKRAIEFGYVNRKGFHSINTQIIIDSQMSILNINARYPGSFHDARIWKSSLAYTFMRDIFNVSAVMGENFEYFLLGDNGFPLQPWLLKPYDTPCTSIAQELFNRIHKEMRSMIERVIGLLKARFRCLLGETKLRYDHQSTGHIIYTCAVLHNLLISKGYPVDDIEPIFDELVGNFEDYEIDESHELEVGQHRRDILAQYFVDIHSIS